MLPFLLFLPFHPYLLFLLLLILFLSTFLFIPPIVLFIIRFLFFPFFYFTFCIFFPFLLILASYPPLPGCFFPPSYFYTLLPSHSVLFLHFPLFLPLSFLNFVFIDFFNLFDSSISFGFSFFPFPLLSLCPSFPLFLHIVLSISFISVLVSVFLSFASCLFSSSSVPHGRSRPMFDSVKVFQGCEVSGRCFGANMWNTYFVAL